MRHGFFDRVIRKNVVKEPEWRARLNTSFLRFVSSQSLVRSEIPKKRLFEKPEVNPLTQHYWEHTFSVQDSPAGTDPWLIELARLNVPEAYTAVCKSFEQFVARTGESAIVYSLNEYWGNPHGLPDSVNIRWLFRLERGDTPEPAQINYSGLAPNPRIPGEPHFELPEMEEIWFPAASPVSQNFHMTIGGRYRFRVLALVERTSDVDLQISAKIRGFQLSSFDNFTLLPLRSVW